jgi:hypothetical protein
VLIVQVGERAKSVTHQLDVYVEHEPLLRGHLFCPLQGGGDGESFWTKLAKALEIRLTDDISYSSELDWRFIIISYRRRTDMPPSTIIGLPVMNWERSERRKSAA